MKTIEEIVNMFTEEQFKAMTKAMDDSLARHPTSRGCDCPVIDVLRIAYGITDKKEK